MIDIKNKIHINLNLKRTLEENLKLILSVSYRVSQPPEKLLPSLDL